MSDQAPQLPTVASESKQVLEIIANAARDPSVDVAKMAALLDMQERLLSKQAVAAFNIEYAAMLPKLPRIKKNGTVEYEDKKSGTMKKAFNFARYEDIDEIIRPILLEHGFSVVFDSTPRTDGGGCIVTGTLLHRDGHSKTASIPLPLDTSGGKNNLQGYGSTISYGKRYAVTMLLNLVFEGEDDDGVRGGMEFIGTAEVCQINALLEQTKADIPRFLQAFSLASVESIQKKDFTRILNALNAKKTKMGAT